MNGAHMFHFIYGGRRHRRPRRRGPAVERSGREPDRLVLPEQLEDAIAQARREKGRRWHSRRRRRGAALRRLIRRRLGLAVRWARRSGWPFPEPGALRRVLGWARSSRREHGAT